MGQAYSFGKPARGRSIPGDQGKQTRQRAGFLMVGCSDGDPSKDAWTWMEGGGGVGTGDLRHAGAA